MSESYNKEAYLVGFTQQTKESAWWGYYQRFASARYNDSRAYKKGAISFCE